MGAGYYFISFLGAVHGSVLGSLFFRRRWNNTAARLLGIYILILSLGLFERFVMEYMPAGVFRNVISGFLSSSNLLYGPLLYLFVLYLVRGNPAFRKKHTLHFIPFLLNYVSVFIPPDFGDKEITELFDLLFFELFMVQVLWYSIVATRILKKHRQHLLSYYSSFDADSYLWVQRVLIVVTGVYILSFVITHLLLFGVRVEGLYIYVQLAITAGLYVLGYKMLLQPGIFEMNLRTAEAQQPKYEKSGLKGDYAQQILETLHAYMKEHKPYLDPEFSLHGFAQEVSITRNYITQVLNVHLNKNFYEFVNEYRVEEAKALMSDPGNDILKLPAIGMQAGFKSKTAFNTNFKKITGLTPTEWKKTRSEIP